MDNNKEIQNNEFMAEIDTWWTTWWVVDAPTIEYDQKEIKPWLIIQQKWDIIYKAIIFISLIILYVMNSFLSSLYVQDDKLAAMQLQIDDIKNVVKKIEQTTSWINYDKLIVNKFMLENIFFVWDKKYEIIQKFNSFFNDPKVISKLGEFQLWTISIQWDDNSKSDIKKYQIKIEGHFNSFNKDLKWMISFLDRMIPVVVIDNISFSKWNSVVFQWYILVLKKDLLKYDYGKNYKQINTILRLKEEYSKNSLILDKMLADKDLWLKKLWIDKLYNCDQYKEIIQKKNLLKEKDLEQCYDVETMLKNIKWNLDKSFNSLIK